MTSCAPSKIAFATLPWLAASTGSAQLIRPADRKLGFQPTKSFKIPLKLWSFVIAGSLRTSHPIEGR